MVSRGQRGKLMPDGPLLQRGIARRTGSRLDVAGFNRDGQRFMRNVQIPANRSDVRRFGSAFRAQAMIHGRRRNPAWQGCGCQHQQRQAVWPARHRQPQPPAVRPQRPQIGGEAFA